MIKFDNIEVPSPSGYTYAETDIIENKVTNANGQAQWDVVRYGVGSLNLSWDDLESVDISLLASAIKNKQSFPITFLNPLSGEIETRTFSPGGRSSKLISRLSELEYYSSLSVLFTEV